MDENNFYSIDRLIEFGMSMAIARQMIQSMNDMMANMHIPGAMNPMHTQEPRQPNQMFYAILDGKQAGPFSETELTRLIMEKKVVKETYIWIPGMKEWQLAENVQSVLRLVALKPPEFNITI
jgi:hypothetical protein